MSTINIAVILNVSGIVSGVGTVAALRIKKHVFYYR